jgi:hypothetical protein
MAKKRAAPKTVKKQSKPSKPKAIIKPKLNDKSPLSAKETRMVDEYLVDLNPRRAAEAAGYSASYAGARAWQILCRPHVAEAITKKKVKRLKRLELSQDRAVHELAAIKKIKSVKRPMPGGGERTEIEVELHDKLGTLRSLMIHLGLLPHKGDVNIIIDQRKYVDALEAPVRDMMIDSFEAEARSRGLIGGPGAQANPLNEG